MAVSAEWHTVRRREAAFVELSPETGKALREEMKAGVNGDLIKSCVIPACVNGAIDLSVGMCKYEGDLRGKLTQQWRLRLHAPGLLRLCRFSVLRRALLVFFITGETRAAPPGQLLSLNTPESFRSGPP